MGCTVDVQVAMVMVSRDLALDTASCLPASLWVWKPCLGPGSLEHPEQGLSITARTERNLFAGSLGQAQYVWGRGCLLLV